MSQLLVHYDTVLRSGAGVGYIPSAWGRRTADVWEGWIEFEPIDRHAERLRTGRETEQASRDGLTYWAEGLTQVFLEGALERALQGTGSSKGPNPDANA